jgi:glyoxylase-like metal-dependent hydrolase (beta-lactamase superfamily II)/rhodanese-related sulfurtransferase
MIFQQFYLTCLAHASYLIGDESSKRAVVVDPQRDVGQYVTFARERGLTITDVVLTHFHADFVAGHLALRDQVGATVHLGRRAPAEFAFHALADGDVIDLGQVRLRTIETPGHTPEGISLVVSENGAAPSAVLTGDTLFVGDVGRPDLMASVGVTADSLARELFASLRKLAVLPDEVKVYPAHGAGSMCGKSLGKETFSTIGREKLGNYALNISDEAAFIAAVTADQPEAPAYFGHDAAFNKREHDTAEHRSTQLSVPQMQDAIAAGAQVLDVRETSAFAGAHVTGSINVGLRGQFAMWAGAVLDPKRDIVLVTDPGDQDEALTRLRRIGFDRLRGHLDGGMAALAAYPTLVRGSRRVEPDELRRWLQRADAPLVIDVRRHDEHATGNIAGSRNVPLQVLGKSLADLPRDREIVVHCAGGYRSAIAASLLAANGFTVADLVGGYGAWKGASAASCVLKQ